MGCRLSPAQLERIALVSADFSDYSQWNGKGSIDIDHLNALGLSDLGRMCAWCLAHAHARTGDSVAIANYLGGTDEFDQAIAAFAQAYAEQNEEDYSLFRKLIKKGELPCSKKSGAKK